MQLVIVESPTKAKTIGRFLGKDYDIKASMGHLVDLPKSTLGVDVEHDFQPQFDVVVDKKKTISELQAAAKSADTIILATDPDREGEAIAHHVREILPISNTTKKQIKRIVFHEITKEAVEEALRHPREIDDNLVNAQTARRVLDRLVGYKLSPLLWKKVRRGLSAGRVQSVALRLIVEREREIEKFGKESYWTILAMLGSKEAVEFELIEINGEKIETQQKFPLYDGEYTITKTTIDKEDAAKKIVEDLRTQDFVVADVVQKETRRSPQPPYTTSTLQQDASRRLGFSGKRTMAVAQRLYEEGYITYHRTDSVTVANTALAAIRSFVQKAFGEKYVPEKPRFYTAKQKLAQEAHEAIRPTNTGEGSIEITKSLGKDAGKLYDIIWRRAIASQMSDAITESTTVIVTAGSYKLKATGSVLVFEGFLKVNPQALADRQLAQYKVSEKLTAADVLSVPHETQPPPRYNDASLVHALEEKGIGRPSTYAPIISTIEGRQYIEREEGRFRPTTVGIAVNDFLVTNFPHIDDIPFTAEMEDGLDEIAHGKREWTPMIKDFWGPFEKKLIEVEGAARVKIEVEETNEKCEKCQANLVIRIGRFGKFLSCSRFPDCDYTRAFVLETNLTCPRCQSKIIIKKTRRGKRFYGCSSYPKCDFAAWKIEDIQEKTAYSASKKKSKKK